jgi:hypothetical protein
MKHACSFAPPVLAVAGMQALETASGVAERVRTGLECNMASSVFRGLVETTSPSVSIGAGQFFQNVSDGKAALLRSDAYRSLYFSQFPELFGASSGERLLELVLQPTAGTGRFPPHLADDLRLLPRRNPAPLRQRRTRLGLAFDLGRGTETAGRDWTTRRARRWHGRRTPSGR